jgi:hypothetical protein
MSKRHSGLCWLTGQQPCGSSGYRRESSILEILDSYQTALLDSLAHDDGSLADKLPSTDPHLFDMVIFVQKELACKAGSGPTATMTLLDGTDITEV